MKNNAKLGFTFQALICEKYNIDPDSERAKTYFKSNYDISIDNSIQNIIDELFKSLNLYPIECTTFKKDTKTKNDVPYNFILSDNSTLSIRTNFSGDKVAPREVGQAGYDKLNKYFGAFYPKEIKNKNDIKELFNSSVNNILPIFFDFLFDADYIVWVYTDGCSYKYYLIKGDCGVNIEYKRENFTFTREIHNWNESTTIKYKNVSIAEVQVHKNRTFKLRFIMKNVIPLIYEKQANNETFGITAEKTVCDLYNLKYPNNFLTRYSSDLQYQLNDVILDAFRNLPHPVKHCGSENGKRGGNSKSSFDFILYGNKTLSLKTNYGKKVCPPEVGQPNNKTCYLYFKDFIDVDYIDKNVFKKMVFDKIEYIIPVYLKHLFDADYLLRIFENTNKDIIRTGEKFGYNILEKNHGENFLWEKELFNFSQTTIEDWNESNTVYYKNLTLGEFQIHNNRNCFKFRFHFDNLIKIIKS